MLPVISATEELPHQDTPLVFLQPFLEAIAANSRFVGSLGGASTWGGSQEKLSCFSSEGNFCSSDGREQVTPLWKKKDLGGSVALVDTGES